MHVMLDIKGTVRIIQVNMQVMLDIKGTVRIISSEHARNDGY